MSSRRLAREDLMYATLKYMVLTFLLGVIVLPLLYTISVSFRTPAEFFADPHLVPRDPTLEPWRIAVSDLGPFLENSVAIATGTAVLSLLLTIPGAYVFGRLEFPGKKVAFYTIVAALLFPYILLVIPISDIWYELELYNTVPGVWLAYQVFVLPFSIWILRDFFEKLPSNLEEAAQVYGLTQFSAFVRVILPLSLPAIVAVGFLAFLVGWNDYIFASFLTDGSGPRPAVVQLFLNTTAGERVQWQNIMAQTLLVGVPPTVLYLIARRYLSNAFAV